jgi:2-dehydropantoate 2-reductase
VKIAVVGCGALGSYYGAKLCRAGYEVHFLLRSDYDVVRQRGVTIHSRDGDFNARPRCARTPDEIGVADLVMIGLKTSANAEFPNLLLPLVAKRTAVLTLQNGLGNEEQLAKLLGSEQVLGGLCFVCLNRVAPGVVHHIDHGRIVLGEFQRSPESRTYHVASLYRQAGVHCEVTEDLARAHWEKLVWNIPFNGLGVASAAGFEAMIRGQRNSAGPLNACLTTRELLSDPRWENIVRELMNEVIAVANALGHRIDPGLADKQIERTRTMGAYKASTLIDFERRQPLELHSLFLEPLRQAQKAGIATPRLTTLCAVLEQLDWH